MIGKLIGLVDELEDATLILNVNGIGFTIHMAPKDLKQLSLSQTVAIYTHISWSQETMKCFGFLSQEEKCCFLGINQVKGIGGKLALSVINALTAIDLSHLVETENCEALQQIPGIGKKTAERLLMELKHQTSLLNKLSMKAPSASILTHPQEALSILLNLGIKRQQAKQILQNIPSDLPIDQMIRKALHHYRHHKSPNT